jgi:hypothetical protein
LRWLEGLAQALPLSAVRRHLLITDVKVFLRDVSQWSQLLLLLVDGLAVVCDRCRAQA